MNQSTNPLQLDTDKWAVINFPEPDRVYRVKYQWGEAFKYGWGRYAPQKHSQVDIICEHGGVTYQPRECVDFLVPVHEPANRIQWSERYSETEEYDNMGRWAREGYYRNIRVAWIKRVRSFDTGTGNYQGEEVYSLSCYLPTNGNDGPQHAGVYKTYEEAQARAEKELATFLTVFFY